MEFWNSLASVEKFSTLLNWFAALAVLGALAFGVRAGALREQIEIARDKQLANIKEQAASPILVFSAYEIEKVTDGITLTAQFSPNKNTPLGELAFAASVPQDSAEKIVNFWPSLKGGAFLSSDDSKKISADGKSATLNYSLMAVGRPTVLLTVSGPTTVTLTGNHELQPVQVPIQ